MSKNKVSFYRNPIKISFENDNVHDYYTIKDEWEVENLASLDVKIYLQTSRFNALFRRSQHTKNAKIETSNSSKILKR